MISTLSSTPEGPKTRPSGNAAQSSYCSAAEPLKRHAQRQRRSVYVVFSGRAAQPCAFGQTSAAAPLSNLLAWRSLSFFLACADVSILKACVLFAQSCLLCGMDESQEEDPAFAPRLAWRPERRLTELATFDGVNSATPGPLGPGYW